MEIKKILKSKNIIKTDPEDTISSALSLLSSSHDAAFVFEDDAFLGIVNPYHVLIKKSYPANTKIRNGMMHPPKTTFAHKVEHVVHMMLESKLHYLPVFDGRDFVGIVSARRVMKNILDAPQLQIPISRVLQGRKELHTVKETDFISAAMAKFKDSKVSKLIVLDDKEKLAGILAYYDLIDYLAKPQKRQSAKSRKGRKDALMKKAVKNFQKTRVLTLSREDTLADAAKLMTDKKIGSVVIVDKDNQPQGIVTTRDVLSAYTKKVKPSLAELHGKNLSRASQATADAFISALNTVLEKVPGVKKAEVMITEKKKGGIYEAAVSVFRTGKKTRVFRSEDVDLKSVLQDIKGKAKRVLRKK